MSFLSGKPQEERDMAPEGDHTWLLMCFDTDFVNVPARPWGEGAEGLGVPFPASVEPESLASGQAVGRVTEPYVLPPSHT